MDTLLPLIAAVITLLALDAGEMGARAARARRPAPWGGLSADRVRQKEQSPRLESPKWAMCGRRL